MAGFTFLSLPPVVAVVWIDHKNKCDPGLVWKWDG